MYVGMAVCAEEGGWLRMATELQVEGQGKEGRPKSGRLMKKA